MNQLIFPSIPFGIIMVLGIINIYRGWSKVGSLGVWLMGIVLGGLGCLWGLIAQATYVIKDAFEFLGTGKYYDYPGWLGGVIGGALGFIWNPRKK